MITLRHRRLAATVLGLAAIVLASCGEDNADRALRSDPPTPAAMVSGEAARIDPVIDDKYRVGSHKRELAIRCWGSGRPAVILDAGSASGGIETFGALGQDLIEPLARRLTVCTYDRAGTGATAALSNKRRTIDDQAQELDALLTAADVPKPRVLVGSSWGGFVAVHTARNHPGGIGGLVLLDVPAGNPHFTADQAPDAAWDHPANIERVDSFHAERTMARDNRSLGDLPVTVVTADGGQSDKRDQRTWKQLSSDFSQVVLSGGHDIYFDDPQGVVQQILNTVDRIGWTRPAANAPTSTQRRRSWRPKL